MAAAIQSTWGRADLSSLLPEEVKKAISTIASALDTLTALLNVVSALLDAYSLLLLAQLDAVAAAIQAVIEVIDAALEFLLATSIGVTWFVPKSFRKAPTGQELLGSFGNSMVDQRDPERPLGKSDNHFLMWVALAGAPNIAKLQDLVDGLFKLFKLPTSSERPGLEKGDSYFSELVGKMGWPPKFDGSDAQLPNWRTVKLADLGMLADVVDFLLKIRASIVPANDKVAYVRRMVELIKRRIQDIARKAQEIVEAVADMSALLVSTSGLQVLQVTGIGSIDAQRQALASAYTLPDYPFSGARSLEACAGAVLHLQAGDGGPIKVFKNMVAMSKTSFAESAQGQAAEAARLKVRGVLDKPTGTSKSPGDAFKDRWGGGE